MALPAVHRAADPLYRFLFLSPGYLASLLQEADVIDQRGIIPFS